MMTEYPRHIAFIMDGNGRWALRQALARIRGHERGADVLREITRYCCRNDVKEVTFFALSTENYQSRPRMEIRFLMALLRDYLVGERKEILDNNIRLRAIGRVEELPAKVVTELRTSEKMSEQNDGMILRLALNYGSRGEILDAVGKIAKEIRSGSTSPEHFIGMSEAAFARYLYDPTMTDPDLLIRTAGEIRVSNFLLWQISYAELWVTDAPWPEFSVDLLERAIEAFRSRERKFGSLQEPALLRKDDEA